MNSIELDSIYLSFIIAFFLLLFFPLLHIPTFAYSHFHNLYLLMPIVYNENVIESMTSQTICTIDMDGKKMPKCQLNIRSISKTKVTKPQIPRCQSIGL
jgi:hypothetical protein